MSPLKPPVAVRPGALVRARSSAALGPRAEDALFRAAQVLAEGSATGEAYFGSTLVTIDLCALSPALAAATAEPERERIFRAVEGSVRVRLRAMRIALADVARRFPAASLGTASVQMRFRRRQTVVDLDVDVEVPLSRRQSSFPPARGVQGRS